MLKGGKKVLKGVKVFKRKSILNGVMLVKSVFKSLKWC